MSQRLSSVALVAVLVAAGASPAPHGQAPASTSPAPVPARPALVAPTPPPATPPALARAFNDADALVTSAFARSRAGSMTVGIVTGSTLAWAKGYGYLDANRKAAAGRNTIYRIGSITKQITALALMQLQERGRLRVSDQVVRYVPEARAITGSFPSASAVTLLALATMTSGLDREPDDLPTFMKGTVEEWDRVLLASLARTRFVLEPGTRQYYSNIGYGLLGAALARAAGEPYVSYVMREIITPLGMTSTRFQVAPADRHRLATGYAVRDRVIDAETPRLEHEGRGYKIPNGGLYSTVSDLARWLAFELGDVPAGVLSRQTFDEWLGQVHTASADLGSGYGIGFQVTRRATLVALGHTGSVAGYTSAAYVDRRSGVGVVVLRAAGGDDLDVTELCLAVLEKVAAAQPRAAATP